ncbi:unannotated protein [freshwater metagenome]|uniref:Unannotated protein n=1 Tax=freshwater metagenome TaxID=449393 RepID=A0A6J6A1S3_9ZZZZ
MKEFLALCERFVPRNLSPGFTLAYHGHTNAIGVFVQSAECRALGADESL